MLAGCQHPWHDPPAPTVTDVEIADYRDRASDVAYPDVDTAPATDLFAAEPRRLGQVHKEELWDLTLQDAIRMALAHSEILRTSGTFLSPGNPVLANPDFAPSRLDPAIQMSGVLFGQRGVEAALSEFDAQFTTTMTWGRDERIQNNAILGGGILAGQTLVQETADFRMGVQKRLATGGVFGVIHNWDYLGNNVQSAAQLFPSTYTGRVRAEFRQPLLAGSGVEYTRIAGPISEGIQGVTGVQQGVVISRINGDISLADFELAVAAMVRDVETLYWQLYLAYHQFDGSMSVYLEAVKTWRIINARASAELAGGGAIEQSDASAFYWQAKSRLDASRSNLYDVEAQLRRMLGLPVNDGRIIRPIDEPIIARIEPDWYGTLAEGLARRPELRKQKWNIKREELQLTAARNLVRPRLDFVSAYQVNAFGDDLLGDQRDGTTQEGLGNAYRTLTRGNQTGWDLGLEFSLPLGLRFAHAQVRNLELRLAKARAALSEQELEVSHEIADAFRELDATYAAMQAALNFRAAAEIRYNALLVNREADPDRYSRDAVLRARDEVNQAALTFADALVRYNLAILELHYRSGSLLDLDRVHVAEAPWEHEAYFDAIDRAADRARTIPTKRLLHTEPPEFSRPAADEPVPPIPPTMGPAFQGWPVAPEPEQPWSSGPEVTPEEPQAPAGDEQGPLMPPLRTFPPAVPPAEEPIPLPPYVPPPLEVPPADQPAPPGRDEQPAPFPGDDLVTLPPLETAPLSIELDHAPGRTRIETEADAPAPSMPDAPARVRLSASPE